MKSATLIRCHVRFPSHHPFSCFNITLSFCFSLLTFNPVRNCGWGKLSYFHLFPLFLVKAAPQPACPTLCSAARGTHHSAQIIAAAQRKLSKHFADSNSWLTACLHPLVKFPSGIRLGFPTLNWLLIVPATYFSSSTSAWTLLIFPFCRLVG